MVHQHASLGAPVLQVKEATMYGRILVPLDGSELAETALPLAETLARAAGGVLYLVRAAAAEEQAAATGYLERQVAALRARGIAAEWLAITGPPAEAITGAVAAHQLDLVVMTTHGRSGLQQWVLGSVADEVLHRSAVPVVLARAGQTAPAGWPRRVLVPLDGSELAAQALDCAQAVAGPTSELLLYQALSPATPIVPDPSPGSLWAEVMDVTRAEGLAYLENVAAPLRQAGLLVRTAAEFGVPAQQIAACARQQQVDLVVLSSHGRSGVGRWLLGSVADELVRTTPAPLLLLRPLLAAARQPLRLVEREPMPLGSAPPPPTSLEVTGHEAQLIRLALETLLWDTPREEHLTAEIQALLARLPTGPATAPEAAPAVHTPPDQ
jgi:nucleotide-binding universal stress UspA family protein